MWPCDSSSTQSGVLWVQALQAVLGSDSGSLFSEKMLNNSVDAFGSAYDIVPYPGDSFSDQVQDYVATARETERKVPLGVSVGVAVAGAAILAAAAMLTLITVHHRRQSNRQKVSVVWHRSPCSAEQLLPLLLCTLVVHRTAVIYTAPGALLDSYS